MAIKELNKNIHPLDHNRDPVSTARVWSLAARVAALYGGKLARMQRANGYSNATWVGDGIAVRIAYTAVDMACEVAFVRAFPEDVGYPEILGYGITEGHSWIVTREICGHNLHDIWPTLTPAQQGAAVRQLWTRVQIVHNASPSLGSLIETYGGFIPPTINAALESANRAAAKLRLSSDQQSQLHKIIEDYFRAAPLAEQVVNHGDLALMNALWKEKVIALLDVEFAVLGPVEIDLCRLVCEACVSSDGYQVDSKAGNAAIEIAARYMDPVHGPALIHGAAILDQLRDIDIWKASEDVEDWRPCRLLAGLLSTDGGYLAPLIGSL